MNAERLLAHYERIADTPDAVARLRRFILDLAVRGKLVPQNLNDEPASGILKRISATKARLIKAGEIRKRDDLHEIDENILPYAIPLTWRWCRLGGLGFTQTGTTPPKAKAENYGDYIPFIRPGNIFETQVEYSGEGLSKIGVNDFGRIAPAGSLLMVCIGTIGKCQTIDRPCSFNQQINSLSPYDERISSYLLIACRSDFFQKSAWHASARTTIAILNKGNWEQLQVPLPPLDEQHRIVAKVDELMALCDRLEAARAKRETTRDRLAVASLARLNTPDPDTFHGDARFALDALPALTTRPDQIKQLRQTILNLAVRGKLVPQDPNDGSINVTLGQAMARRAALVRTKKVRQKKFDGNNGLAAGADLPSNWTLERLGNLVDPENTISYGVLVPGDDVPDGVPFVRAQDLALSSHPERPNKTISHEIERPYARTRLRGGEILVCVVGSIGKLGIVPQSWAGANIARAVARILPIQEVSREYLLIVLRGEPVQRYFTETTRTLAQPTLNVGLIEQTPIPLPPLNEQHRIVAKVDELMTLCDRLEASLADTSATRSHLLDALLQETLTPAEPREQEAA